MREGPKFLKEIIRSEASGVGMPDIRKFRQLPQSHVLAIPTNNWKEVGMIY